MITKAMKQNEEVTDLTVSEREAYLMPVLTIAEAIERYESFQQLVGKLLKTGEDYGVLPNTKNHMLFKPGAEKLAAFFGLQVSLTMMDAQTDWDKGFFYYRYNAVVSKKGIPVVDCDRSCNSREKKYAWVWVETKRKPTDDEADEAMQLGTGKWEQRWHPTERGKKVRKWMERRPNPDPYSLVNTIQAMAQKRAYVGAVLIAVNASGFFSKAVEITDVIDAEDAQEVTNDPTAFWQKANEAGIRKEDAQPIAQLAIDGSITWGEAIGRLPK